MGSKPGLTNEASRAAIWSTIAGGAICVAPMAPHTDEDIAEIISLNLTGHLFGARRAAAVMLKLNSGVIVTISDCAIHAWPGWGHTRLPEQT